MQPCAFYLNRRFGHGGLHLNWSKGDVSAIAMLRQSTEDAMKSDLVPLGFLANLDHVSLGVVHFKELGITPVLNWSDKRTTDCELLVPFL